MVKNDLVYDHNHKYPHETEVYDFLQKSCPQEEFTYRWINIENSKNRLKNGIVPSFSDKFSNRCWVEKVVNEISLRNTRFFFFSTFSLNNLYLPSINHLNSQDIDRLTWRMVELDYVRLIEGSGGTVVNRLDVPVKSSRFSKMESHPSKESHLSFAESLFREVTTNPKWGFLRF